MSFAMTEEQVLQQTKDVTRRLGWKFLKPGDVVQPVRKSMGLRKGEKVVKLGPPIRIVSNTPEALTALLGNQDYGFEELAREGFAMHAELDHPKVWIEWFAKGHGCTTDQVVNRIEFDYTEKTK
jgi:hypothetical protein